MAVKKIPNPRYELVSVRFSESEKCKLIKLAGYHHESVAATLRRAVKLAFPLVMERV